MVLGHFVRSDIKSAKRENFVRSGKKVLCRTRTLYTIIYIKYIL
jgi:hypothetical protein